MLQLKTAEPVFFIYQLVTSQTDLAFCVTACGYFTYLVSKPQNYIRPAQLAQFNNNQRIANPPRRINTQNSQRRKGLINLFIAGVDLFQTVFYVQGYLRLLIFLTAVIIGI